MRLRLYVIPASHPCDCVVAALELKGLAFERIDMVPVAHRLQGRLSYGAITAPGLRIDDERLAGSRKIMRRLDELVAEPPLFPADAGTRRPVEEAEAWGEEVLQPLARRLCWAVLRRRPAAIEGYAANAKLPLPMSLGRPGLPLLAGVAARLNGVSGVTTRADLRALSAHLDRVDGWLDEGRLGGHPPNAADLQIGSSLRLLASLGDLAPVVQRHRCAVLTRYFPPLAGEAEAGALPPAWIPAA